MTEVLRRSRVRHRSCGWNVALVFVVAATTFVGCGEAQSDDQVQYLVSSETADSLTTSGEAGPTTLTACTIHNGDAVAVVEVTAVSDLVAGTCGTSQSSREHRVVSFDLVRDLAGNAPTSGTYRSLMRLDDPPNAGQWMLVNLFEADNGDSFAAFEMFVAPTGSDAPVGYVDAPGWYVEMPSSLDELEQQVRSIRASGTECAPETYPQPDPAEIEAYFFSPEPGACEPSGTSSNNVSPGN